MIKPPTPSGVTPPPDGATYLGTWSTAHPSSGVLEPSDYYLIAGGDAGMGPMPDAIWRRTRNHWYGVGLASDWPARRAELGDPLPNDERTA